MSSAEAEPQAEVAFEGIIDRSVFLDYLETFESVVTEATLEFGPDGIYAQPVDPGNVAMVNQTLYREAFESYETLEFEIGVNLERLADYLGKGQTDLAQITFSNEDRRFHIEMGEVSLSLAGIPPESVRNGQTPPEELELTTDVRMEGAALDHAVDVASMISDHIVIECDPDRDRPFHVIGEGDTDDARIRFGDSLEEGSTVPEACESLFSADYFNDLVGVIPSDSSVRLQSGDEFPVLLQYEYADGNVDVEMMLAPRISAERGG